MPNWTILTEHNQIESLILTSFETPCMIYKHSTRCDMSAMTYHVLESDWSFKEQDLKPYFIDILAYSNLSVHIADTFKVHHESPQVILVRNGICTFDTSHLDISIEEIKEGLEDDFWLS